MAKQRLGVIVIGQSPRRDCEAILQGVLGPDVEIDLRGALDGLSRQEVGRITPRDGADTLFTRLPDGEAVTISKQVVTERAQDQLDRFAREGTDVTLMFCTGAFQGLASRGPVVFPSAVLAGLAQGLLPQGRLGLLVPLPEQAPHLAKKWQRPGVEVVAEALVPGSNDAAVDATAARLAAGKPDLVVMDCMSYSQATKERVRRVTGARAVLAVTATARTIQELLA
jgi:protein AroM